MLTRMLLLFCVFGLNACGSSESEDDPPTNASNAGAGGDDGGAGGSGGEGGEPVSAGAGGASGAGGAGTTATPETLHLEGNAASEPNADGEHVECSFYGDIVDLVFDDEGSFTGIAVGELFRSAFVDGNKVSEFAPLIGGESTLTQRADGSVELRFVGDQPDDALEFWLSLEVVEGEHEGDYRYTGSWTCSPGLLDDPGFQEFDIEAEGTWTLDP